MGTSFSLTVKREGQPEAAAIVRLPPSYQDQVAFESFFGESATSLEVAHLQFLRAVTEVAGSDDPDDGGLAIPFDGTKGLRTRWLAFLAWRMLRRNDPTLPEFEAFEVDLEEVTVVGVSFGGASADPTGPAAPTAPAAPPGS